MSLNVPSGLVQLPYVTLNPDKQEWIPRELDFKTWRVISWPLIGILFWWSAGRAIEALLAARRDSLLPRLSLTETVGGAVLFVFCAVVVVCFPLYEDENRLMGPWIAGFCIWAVLGGVMIVARVAQWRVRRRTAV
jgi:hypothetical protein